MGKDNEKKASKLDLAAFDTVDKANSGQEMEVLHPATGESIGSYIILAGADSEVYRAAQRKIANKRLSNPSFRGQFKLTVEQLEVETLELLARCTLSWREVVYKGEQMPCTPENAKMLYKALPWLRDQVNGFIEDRSNFLSS